MSMKGCLYDKEIYLMFYTSLLNDAGIYNQGVYTPSITDLFFDNKDVHFITRLFNYTLPPFSHVKIAIKNSSIDGFLTFTFNGGDGFSQGNGTYLHRSGFSVIKLGLTNFQYKILVDILEYFKLHSDEKDFSTYKLLLIGGKLRQYTCSSGNEYPSIDLKSWYCSEFVCFCLQQCGVIDLNSIHPSYCTPMHLFYSIINNDHIKIEGSYNPFFSHRNIKDVICLDDTNSITVFEKIMKIGNLTAIRSYARSFLKGSLCYKLRPKKMIMTQYVLMMSSGKCKSIDDCSKIIEDVENNINSNDFTSNEKQPILIKRDHLNKIRVPMSEKNTLTQKKTTQLTQQMPHTNYSNNVSDNINKQIHKQYSYA